MLHVEIPKPILDLSPASCTASITR